MNTCETYKYWKQYNKLHYGKFKSLTDTYDDIEKFETNEGNYKRNKKNLLDKTNPNYKFECVKEEKKENFFGDCSCPKFVYDVTSEERSQLENSDQLSYCDNEAYAAHFSTGKNFGCVHHKEN